MSLEGWTVYSFDSLTSTQDVARDYVGHKMAEGKPLPFAILAAAQTAGRGRGGNVWVSTPTGNLYTSLAVPVPSVPLRLAGQYSFLAAIAVADTLAAFGVDGIQLKWPNDILVNSRKIAGILLESVPSHLGTVDTLIIGIGVNLKTAPDGATAVVDHIRGESIAPSVFLDRLTKEMQSALDAMTAKGFPVIREKWLDRAYGVGQRLRVRLPSETFYGEFVGLDDSGALQVISDGETRPRYIHSGDVFFDIKDK